ncbi:MAG TPA: hypothetical protein VK824_06605 [Planctomycetota bacterium]|nr:hypothetical protein [Planctomycetota bacterium]
MPPTTPTRRDARLPGRLGALVAAAILLAEAGLYAVSQRDALHANLRVRDSVRGAASGDPNFVPLAAFEGLEDVARSVPPDARVLVVTSSPLPTAYDFPLLPRPVHLLFAVDGLLAQAAGFPGPTSQQALDWVASLEQRGQRLAPGTLAEQLAAADVLITVLIEPSALPWPEGAPRPQLLARSGLAAAWRLATAR